MPKQKAKSQAERLASVNNAVKILTPLLEKAGCNSKIQLLQLSSFMRRQRYFFLWRFRRTSVTGTRYILPDRQASVTRRPGNQLTRL